MAGVSERRQSLQPMQSTLPLAKNHPLWCGSFGTWDLFSRQDATRIASLTTILHRLWGNIPCSISGSSGAGAWPMEAPSGVSVAVDDPPPRLVKLEPSRSPNASDDAGVVVVEAAIPDRRDRTDTHAHAVIIATNTHSCSKSELW